MSKQSNTPAGRGSTIWLTVELSPGNDIENCCADIVRLASQLGVAVHAKFNDVLLMAHPGDDYHALVRGWKVASDSKSTYKIATAK